MSNEHKEPEDLIANALYLLQLCQQDINMGRWETVWPRAVKARNLCNGLSCIAFEEIKSKNIKAANALKA